MQPSFSEPGVSGDGWTMGSPVVGVADGVIKGGDGDVASVGLGWVGSEGLPVSCVPADGRVLDVALEQDQPVTDAANTSERRQSSAFQRISST